MATTRLMTRHTGSGMAIMETLKDGFDYGKNPDKTRNGNLILSYECDPATADAEFLLSKAKYKAITGKMMCCITKSGSRSRPEKPTRKPPLKSAMTLPCAGRKADTLFSWFPTLTAPTLIAISTTIPPRWTAPGNSGTLSARPCGAAAF